MLKKDVNIIKKMAKEECMFSGATARMLGISKTTLFEWDKKGILVPEKVEYGSVQVRIYFKQDIEYFMANADKFKIRKKF